MKTITIDIAPAVHALKGLQGQLTGTAWNQALARTINRVGGAGRTRASREIRKEYRIKKKDLDIYIHFEKAHSRKAVGTLFTFGTPIPAHNFKPRQNKRGVAVSIKAGARQTIPHAFIATPKKGKRKGDTLVFARGDYKGDKFVYNPARDAPISIISTVSIGAMFGNPTVLNPVVDSINDALPKRLVHEVSRLLAPL